MDLFPIFLKLTARPCLVIGAGNLAESKIESLRAAHAKVTVIAPEARERIVEMAESGEIEWLRREFRAGDVNGRHPAYFLVVTATDVGAVNRAVYAEATAANIICNAVDDPPFCDFYFPSVVRRGDLQIAISTAGASPALAQRLRKEINAQLPLDTGDWLTDLGNLRREVTQMEPLNEERKMLLHQLATREVCGYDGCPSRVLAREHAKTNPMAKPDLSHPTHRDEAAMNGAPGLFEAARSEALAGLTGDHPTHRDEAAMNGAPGLLEAARSEALAGLTGHHPTHRDEAAMNGAPALLEAARSEALAGLTGHHPTHRDETAMNGAPGLLEAARSKALAGLTGDHPTHRDEAAMHGEPGAVEARARDRAADERGA